MGSDPKPAFLCKYHATKANAEKHAAELRKQGCKVTVQPAGNYRGGGWLVTAKRRKAKANG